MGRHGRLAVRTGDSNVDGEFVSSFALVDALVQGWTNKEAQAVTLRLARAKQVEIAEYLEISQPAVNQRLHRAGWRGIEALLHRWRVVIGDNLGGL